MPQIMCTFWTVSSLKTLKHTCAFETNPYSNRGSKYRQPWDTNIPLHFLPLDLPLLEQLQRVEGNTGTRATQIEEDMTLRVNKTVAISSCLVWGCSVNDDLKLDVGSQNC